MKRKSTHPLRPKGSRWARTSKECTAKVDTMLTSNSPANSATVPQSASQNRHLTLSQHSRNLLKFLNEDRTRQRFCDVSVSVGGNLYNAHKVVLAHGSSYFHAELSKNPDTEHVTLDHVEDSVFQHLLGFLYTSECVIAETELSALTEAARFLDMMDLLKLLCEEGDFHQAPVIQEETRGETTSSKSPAVDTDVQSPPHVQNVTNSQQNHLAEGHHSLQQADPTEKEKTLGVETGTMRRSARRRRTPTKYKRDDLDNCIINPEDNTVPPRKQDNGADDAEEEFMDNQKPKLDVRETSKASQGEDDDENEEEEEERDINEDLTTQRKVDVDCAVDKSAAQQDSHVETTEIQTVQKGKVHKPTAGSSSQTPVYPEGLAPVIIQTSSKKILKCPKCDKTFDRAGGNHVVLSPHYFYFYYFFSKQCQ